MIPAVPHDARFEATVKVDQNLVDRILRQPSMFSTQLVVKALQWLHAMEKEKGKSEELTRVQQHLAQELDRRIAQAQPRLRKRSYSVKGPPRIYVPGTGVEVWNPRRPIPRPQMGWWRAMADSLDEVAGDREEVKDGTIVGVDVANLRLLADAIRLMLPASDGGYPNPNPDRPDRNVVLPRREHLILPPGYQRG